MLIGFKKRSDIASNHLGLNNAAEWMRWDEMRNGVPCGPYKGKIPNYCWLPKGTVANVVYLCLLCHHTLW